MTPPVDEPETLRRILANTEALLLDFDGPICSVFSDIPASVVADQLRGILAEGGHTDLRADIRIATDPLTSSSTPLPSAPTKPATSKPPSAPTRWKPYKRQNQRQAKQD